MEMRHLYEKPPLWAMRFSDSNRVWRISKNALGIPRKARKCIGQRKGPIAGNGKQPECHLPNFFVEQAASHFWYQLIHAGEQANYGARREG